MSASEKTGTRDEETRAASRQEQGQPEQPPPPKAEAEKPRKDTDETELFAAGTDPQYFGTGSYGSGGSNQEGHYGMGDINPRGGYGSFTDAGGYGSPSLYGEEAPPEDEPQDDTESRPAEKRRPTGGGKQP